MEERIMELGKRAKMGNMTWKQVADTINKEYAQELSADAVRKRFNRIPYKKEDVVPTYQDYTTEYKDGTIEAQKIVSYNKEIFGDKKKLLEYLGYNPNQWEFVYVTTSTWNQHTKTQETKQLYAVKFKVKPIVNEANIDEAIEIAKELFLKEIKPLKLKKYNIEKSNDNKLMEIPAIELHLGKMAWGGDTGQDYDKNIATERFYNILEEIIGIQEQEKCSNALITIGNDFFNSDTVNATTTKGTPQTNDLRWKKMFLIGLRLYTEFLETLRSKFNNIDVRLCSGNHDKMSSFYLYLTLQQYFRNDDKINFSENYKDYQCYQFGRCAIFFGHGDGNLKRIMHSIPAEFYKEWGSTEFRELHLGHLHKEVTVDDESGMITRRIGSPTGTDQYHYEERFVGATQKHQIFIWDKEKGLKSIEYINFDNKKKLIKRRYK